MLNLIGLALEIFKYCGFLDDVVGELVPLHVVVAVDIDLIEEKGEVAHEGDFTIRYVILPELEVLFGDHNKLIEFELIVPQDELLLQQVNGELVEIEGHVGDHLLVGGLDFLVGSTGRVDGHNFGHIFFTSNLHASANIEYNNAIEY